MTAGGKHDAGRVEDRAATQVGRHLGQVGQRTLARASWTIVVAVCAIAAVLFAFSGYTGYAVTVTAVGLAAAVNLLPSP